MPCPYTNSQSEFIHKPHSCNIPSPFIMSHHRRACINHQKLFFKDQLFHNIKPTTTKTDVIKDTTKDFTNEKISHANLLRINSCS